MLTNRAQSFKIAFFFVILMLAYSLKAANLIHHWPLDEGSGLSVADAGANANNGTLMQGSVSEHGPQWVTDTQKGAVLSFNGDDWISTASHGILGDNPRTVTTWIKLTADTNRHTIIQWGNGTTAAQYFRLLIEARRLRMEVSSGNALALNTGALDLNKWYHIALAVDDFNGDGSVRTTEVKIYVNGEYAPITAGVNQLINTTYTNENCSVHIGGAANFGGSTLPREAMTGLLSDVRIYDDALTPEEIIDSMNQPSAWTPFPANGSNVPVSLVYIGWLPGAHATSFQAYFGTDETAVSQATSSDPRGVYLDNIAILGPSSTGEYGIVFDLEENLSLEQETTYYWRIDGSNPAHPDSPWKGPVWSFTTNPLALTATNLTSTSELPTMTLSWEAPIDIKNPTYDVIISDSPDFDHTIVQVTNLTAESWTVDTHAMLFNQSYYCRVISHDQNNPLFTAPSEPLMVKFTGPVTIEDFNTYTEEDQLQANWQDGTSNTTASSIRLNYDADGQSMRLMYNMTDQNQMARVDHTFQSPQNWLRWGIEILQFQFRGEPANSPAQIFVELTDSENHTARVLRTGSNDDIVQESFSPWSTVRLSLSDFADKNVDLTQIKSYSIGLQTPSQSPCSGIVHIDNIALDTADCLKDNPKSADLNHDCSVDISDLVMLTTHWLAASVQVSAAPQPLTGPLLHYTFDQSATLAHDVSLNANHGTIDSQTPESLWDPAGHNAGCLNLNGSSSIIVPVAVDQSITQSLSISFWLDCSNLMSANGDWLDVSTDNVNNALTVLNTNPQNQWHYICVTHDKQISQSRIFFDGILAAENNNALTDWTNSPTQSRIGSSLNGQYGFMTARIDDFRIYNRPLSHSEVVYLFSGPDSSIQQPLVPLITPYDPVPDNTINLIDIQTIAAQWMI